MEGKAGQKEAEVLFQCTGLVCLLRTSSFPTIPYMPPGCARVVEGWVKYLGA